uniref:Zinc finger PMZ-type domain-containing protein n=1 Tax=Lactuca sativa TaxID=4236 RepID=A0A9R1XFZ5_LACSA|nr:hypothetical protein LSAT_V11C400180290 [Lactuca sativa]
MKQIYGPWMDQCVVNLLQRTCSCRKWEITGIPSKHVVTAMNDKIDNREECCDPQDCVHNYYKFSTWEEMYYKFKVGRQKKKRKRA